MFLHFAGLLTLLLIFILVIGIVIVGVIALVEELYDWANQKREQYLLARYQKEQAERDRNKEFFDMMEDIRNGIDGSDQEGPEASV